MYKDAHFSFPGKDVDIHDMEAVHAEAKAIGEATAQKYLRPLDIIAWPKIALDLFLPILLGLVALVFLALAIQAHEVPKAASCYPTTRVLLEI